MVCSISRDEGLHNLALFQPKKGGGFREITEGDSLDTYPRWVPGRRQVVYQTAGIGRNRDGDWVETAPCEIARLDFDDGEVTTLFANQSHDFLLPQMDANGNLYCIRRPYQPVRNHSFLNSLKDVALFPVRLVQGIFGFLNFFTSTFSGKPLSSAGGPRAATPNAKRLILYGNLVDAEKVAKEYSELADDDSRAAVPRSWELMCFPEVGEPRVLTRGVMTYTIRSNNQIVYSNGKGVFEVSCDGGKPRRLSKRSLVQQLAMVD
jgi:hypothetical protein